jgi:oligoendopeptidase F
MIASSDDAAGQSAYIMRVEASKGDPMSAVASEPANTLPVWNLADLYPSMAAPELSRDLEAAQRAAEAMQARYEGKLAGLSGAEMAAAIAEYEALQDVLGRIMSYAGLVHAGDVNDPKIAQFYQTMQERVTDISGAIVFFTLEINRIDDAVLEAQLRDPKLARYQPWLRDLRVYRPHQLSDDIEKLLHEKYVAGRGAWTRLFEQNNAGLRFPVGNQELTSAEVFNLLSSPDRDKRREAAESIARTMKTALPTLSLIYNTLVKDKEIEDRWRNYARPISSRNLANCVEDEVVDALISAVKASYPALSHRYYALKARWLGLDHLEYWDRNAPLPGDDDRSIDWDEARDTVLGAYGQFSPRMADIGRQFFDKGWIDAGVRPGKSPGAFAHPTVPSAHPYLLLNYQGRTRDVMTLAHELGHGVHQVLAAGQGVLMSDTPLTLAETASVFGEMLTFRRMLDQESDPARRKIMLAGKVEDMINTVVRQTAFAEFERLVHDERRNGELTPDRIGEIWLQIQGESLGPAIRFAPGYEVYWSYIGHFIHTPFYVYAYAFGDCLVNSLYAAYQKLQEGFAERYLQMLSAGGTLRHKELLAPFGLDASDPAFWDRGLSVIRGFIDELEAMG